MKRAVNAVRRSKRAAWKRATSAIEDAGDHYVLKFHKSEEDSPSWSMTKTTPSPMSQREATAAVMNPTPVQTPTSSG